MASWTQQRDQFVSMHGAIARLILINVALYLVMILLFIVDRFGGFGLFHHFFQEWLYLPGDPLKLLTRPWTVVTYMFLHSSSILHILFNMLWLYWFGRIYRHEAGDSGVWSTYLLGGLAGGLLFLLSVNGFPGLADMRMAGLVGASGSVMALVVAAGVRLPNLSLQLLLLGSVRLKWIVLGVLVLDLVGLLGGNAGGSLAHLGGAAAGFVLARRELQGQPVRLPRWLWDWEELPSLFRRRPKPRAKQRSSQNLRVVSTSGGKQPSRRKASPQTDRETELNRILEKINQVGYAKLTQAEKEFLYEASQD